VVTGPDPVLGDRVLLGDVRFGDGRNVLSHVPNLPPSRCSQYAP
jgi:hypothetical protein